MIGKEKEKNCFGHIMGNRFTRISTYLQLTIMSQEAMKRLFKPSQNWLTFQKTLGNPTETPSKKRKRESEDRRQDPSREFAPAVRHPKLTNYDPWHPSDQFQRQQKGNPALLLQPKSSYKFKVYPYPLNLAFNSRPGRYIAIDCEMVEVTGEYTRPRDALARVSAVNYYGYPLLDLFVTPKGRVTDFRTHVSGIRPTNIIHNPDGKYSPTPRHRVDI
jgi:RNA exonuclease 4